MKTKEQDVVVVARATVSRPFRIDNPWVLACLGALVTVALQLVYLSRYEFGPLDDAYIHLRIAHNLATGAGPVFNPGERVEVTSSPLWTLLLGAFLWLGVSGKTAAAALGLATAAGAGAATALLGELVGGTAAAIGAPVLLALLPSFSAWAGSGMETPLAIGALAFATVSALKTQSTGGVARTSALMGLLMYVRPELVAVVPSLLAICLFRLPAPKRVRAGALAAAIVASSLALLLLARYSYFHEWLPNTYYAKVADGGLAQRLRGLTYTSSFLTQHAPYCLLALYAAIRKRAPVTWLGLVVLNLLAATVWAGGDGFTYARLALPALPLVCAMAASLLGELPRVPVRAVAAVAAGAIALLWSLKGTSEFSRYLGDVAYARNAETVARMMSQAPPGTVATVGIGAIAYFSQRRILDLVGLADKHIARARRIPGAFIGHDHVDTDYVLERAPELVLPMPWTQSDAYTDESEIAELERDPGSWASALELLRDPRFRARYVARDYVRDSRHLRIWLRQDLAESQLPAE